MEIRSALPPPLPSADAAPQKVPSSENAQTVERVRMPPARETQGDNEARTATQPRAPAVHDMRMELLIDEKTKEVFGRIIDSRTGKAVREIPPKELRELRAMSLELLGSVIDDVA